MTSPDGQYVRLHLAASWSLVLRPQSSTIPRMKGTPHGELPHVQSPLSSRQCKRRSGVPGAVVWCRRTLHPYAAVLQRQARGDRREVAEEGVQTPATAAKIVTKGTTSSVSAQKRRTHPP
ncbi:hypothetical protein I4F81_012283 [Pyropia yezoensis]|uniref:Uncharacterized protein n=1 Tax=Pyropia yezoensis TaxID=2788 RepID=A0ACC3CIX3_PYRYE|nr:hypothetical protein I4F81_012283 [Neopyropia yezoensis]